jgi:hypothetical protein
LFSDAEPPVIKTAKHPGGFGEKPMEYRLVENTKTSTTDNGYANGKKKHS